jgi:hypothetical protein
MDLQSSASPESGGTPAPEKKKTLFDTVLTATPVLLTVVATFMVGRSAAEMTQAQYHRTVAGQNQSKVGDQWAFFQAKRIRGTTYEVSADVFLAAREPVWLSKQSLLEAVNQLASEAEAAVKTGNSATDKTGAGRIEKDARELAGAARDLKDCLNRGLTTGKYEFSSEQVDAAFATFQEFVATRLPRPLQNEMKVQEDKDVDASSAAATEGDQKTQNQLLAEVIKGINDRKSEKELAALALKIDARTLHDEIIRADAAAKKLADQGRKAESVLEQVDLLVDHLAYTTRRFLRSYDSLPRAKEDEAEKSARHQGDAVRARIDQLVTDFKTARHLFTKNRYEQDARGNQKAAELYEVNVYLSSARSDRHLERSKNFMYAMLVAQVGVIIASLALAVKLRSVVWALAALAGLVAIGFGGYVFLGME